MVGFELWQNISDMDQHLRRIDQVLGLTNQLVPRATDSGVGTLGLTARSKTSSTARNLKKAHLKKRMFGVCIGA